MQEASDFAVLQSRTHEYWATWSPSTMKSDARYTIASCFSTFPFPIDCSSNTELQDAGKSYYDYRSQVMATEQLGLTKLYSKFHNPRLQTPNLVALRQLHAEMDAAVLRAYGWDDLAERAQPEFIEQDADEGKQAKTRLDWPSEFKDEVLARLLALNAERAEAELAAGLTASDEDDEDQHDDGDDE
jgi:hypothetical protein